MKITRSISVRLAFAAFCVSLVRAPVAKSDRITFIVRVPADTPKDDRVYLVGDHPSLGAWRPGMIFCERRSDGRHEATIDLPPGSYEYKFTRGAWSSVETSAMGGDVPNRSLKVTGDATIEATVARWADGQPASTITGTVRIHDNVQAKALGNSRTIAVYLPPNYERDTDRRYPVFYMHDGQNLFDAATSAFGVEWRADETAERLIEAGRIEPLIIVGIYNTPDRLNEYSMERDEKRNAGGRGGDYAKFLIDDVMPFIDKTYRTKRGREHTGVGGSSMGGLISLEIAMNHPDKYSRCAVVSPSLMWNDRSVIKRLRKDASALEHTRIWLDMGTKEGRQIEAFSKAVLDARELADVLKSAGLKPDRDFKYLEVTDGEHNEAGWAGRFDRILTFLFPANSD